MSASEPLWECLALCRRTQSIAMIGHVQRRAVDLWTGSSATSSDKSQLASGIISNHSHVLALPWMYALLGFMVLQPKGKKVASKLSISCVSMVKELSELPRSWTYITSWFIGFNVTPTSLALDQWPHMPWYGEIMYFALKKKKRCRAQSRKILLCKCQV